MRGKMRQVDFRLLIVFGAWILVGGFIQIIESDSPWVLKTGLWIIDNLTIPTQDIFSYTSKDSWLNHEWLSEVVFAVAYRVGGFWLLTAVQGLILFGIWLIAWLHHARDLEGDKRGDLIVPLFAWAVLILLLRDKISIRAQAVTNLLFAASLYLFLVEDHSKTLRHKFLGGVAVLGILWTQIHGGAPHLVILSGLSFLCRRNLNAFLGCVLAALTTCVGPFGVDVHRHFLESHATLPELREWFSALKVFSIFPVYIGLSLILSGLALLGYFVRFRRGERMGFEFIVFLFFLCAALRYNRFFQEVLVVSFFILPKNLHVLCEGWVKTPRFASGKLAVLCLLCMGGLALGRRDFGSGFSPYKFPVEAVNFVKGHGLKGPLFNSYNFGGYLIWAHPEEKVFVDGRAFTVYSDEHIKAISDMYRNLESFLDLEKRFGFKLAILQRTGRGEKLPDFLESHGWTRRYEDELAVVLTRNNEGDPHGRP